MYGTVLYDLERISLHKAVHILPLESKIYREGKFWFLIFGA